MNRHAFRWQSLVFGLLALAAVGSWAVWRQDLLTSHELSLTAAGVLIFLGVVGVAATLWQARPARARTTTAAPAAPTTPVTDDRGDDHEAAHPHP